MNHLVPLSLALAAVATLHPAIARNSRAAPETAASAPAASAALATQPGTPQRSKMKTCNADAKAKDVHGPDRRAFMKQCLSGKAKPAAAS